jgi:iron complex outermembrane receptor protein
MRHHAQFCCGVALAAMLSISQPAYAAEAAAAPAPDSSSATAPQAQEIVVFGRGQTRQVQELSKVDIAAAVPGTSPLKILDKLPSVNFQSASSLGSNEWSTRISVRGFDQSRLGFTLDDVPLGDMSYANFNGLHISRAIEPENIGRTALSQGAGALSTASSSNLGGTIQFYSSDPTDRFGVDTLGTYGSDDTWRLFARVNSGDLGDGVKAYLSGDYLDQPKWKGKGAQHSWHINSKLVVPLGTEGSIKAFVNYSDWADDDYVDMWPDLLSNKGYKWDYLRYDWATAEAIARNLQAGTYTATYPGYGVISGDDAYYDGYGLRKDLLVGANINYKFSDAFSFKVTPYYHRDRGIGTWWTPYVPTPGGAPLSVRSTAYWIDREGLTGSATVTPFDGNTLEVGGWYEHNAYKQAREYFGLADTDHSSIGRLEWPKNPFAYDYQYDFKINTYQYFVQDTWQITDAFKVTGGWKGLEVKINEHYDPAKTPNVARWGTNGALTAKDMFLPQIGANYMLGSRFELFASYAENMRAFTTDPFITSPDAFAALKQNGVKPETSWTAEGGLRFHLPHLEGSLAGYHVKFDNRLFSVSPCVAVLSCPSTLTNVGSVTTNGFEAAGTYRFTRAISLYGSYAYTSAHYDNDVFNGGGELVVASGGKSVVDQPKHLINGELAYDDGTLSGRVHVNYQSKRYATYDNSLAFSGRALVDLNAGYKFHQDGFLGGTEIQLNVTNLFDKKYVATIAQTGGYLLHYTPGALQYFLLGAPRQWYVTIKKSF